MKFWFVLQDEEAMGLYSLYYLLGLEVAPISLLEGLSIYLSIYIYICTPLALGRFGSEALSGSSV